MANILIVDDEKDIVRALKIYLSSEQYTTFAAYTGKEALEILEREEIQLVLMDIMMPEMDGISALSILRETSNVPVILLTAKSEDADKIMGLNIGADDYITKPFNPVELLARVRSQLRRYLKLGGSPAGSEQSLKVGPFVLDDKTKTLTMDGEPVTLTPTEYKIMQLLMSRPGEVLSPKEIYRQVWKDEPYGADSTVAVHIRHLREKVEINPADPRYLKVVWAQGYKLCDGHE